MKIKKSTAFLIAFFTFVIMWFCTFIFKSDYLETVGNLILTIIGSITVGFIGLQVADNTLKGKNYIWQMDENYLKHQMDENYLKHVNDTTQKLEKMSEINPDTSGEIDPIKEGE